MATTAVIVTFTCFLSGVYEGTAEWSQGLAANYDILLVISGCGGSCETIEAALEQAVRHRIWLSSHSF